MAHKRKIDIDGQSFGWIATKAGAVIWDQQNHHHIVMITELTNGEVTPEMFSKGQFKGSSYGSVTPGMIKNWIKANLS